MLTFPNAKINLGLNITEKRTDGYHNIESCFYPIPVKDALEIIPSDKIEFVTTGLKIPGDYEHNLVLKAYRLIKAKFDIPTLKIILHKNIPMGAGMGGGSADGSFMLKLLNDYFQLSMKAEELEELALVLGSDCPFFVKNKPKLVSGRGEIFEPTYLDLSAYKLALIYPKVKISTAEAYRGVIPEKPEISVKEIIEVYPVEKWKECLKNDFEEGVFKNHPELLRHKESLYDQGAVYASMTGSGSTLFGLFDKSVSAKSIKCDQIVELE